MNASHLVCSFITVKWQPTSEVECRPISSNLQRRTMGVKNNRRSIKRRPASLLQGAGKSTSTILRHTTNRRIKRRHRSVSKRHINTFSPACSRTLSNMCPDLVITDYEVGKRVSTEPPGGNTDSKGNKINRGQGPKPASRYGPGAGTN